MARSNGGIAEVAEIRRWAPLPETADELCNVAHDLGVGPTTHLYIGAAATASAVVSNAVEQHLTAGPMLRWRDLCCE